MFKMKIANVSGELMLQEFCLSHPLNVLFNKMPLMLFVSFSLKSQAISETLLLMEIVRDYQTITTIVLKTQLVSMV